MNKEDLIYEEFDFLESDLNYRKYLLVEYKSKKKVVVIYENRDLKKRIEIATSISDDNNHILIRYLCDSDFADYDDKKYCIDMSVLYRLKCNSYEVDYNFYPFDKTEVYFEKSRALLLNYKLLLSTQEWIDFSKYNEIVNAYYVRKYGAIPEVSPKSVQKEFGEKLLDSFLNAKTLYDSEKQPPYDTSEGCNTSKYEVNGHLIVFRQPDWRDYNLYDVTIDNLGGYSIDTQTNYQQKIMDIMKEISRRCG